MSQRFVCSTDVRLVTRQLVRRYIEALNTPGAEAEVKEFVPQDADVLQKALRLVQLAFQPNPRYFFTNFQSLSDVPFHCLTKDILTSSDLQNALENTHTIIWEDFFLKKFGNIDDAMYCFLDEKSVFPFGKEALIYSAFEKLSRLESHGWNGVAQKVMKGFQTEKKDTDHIIVWGESLPRRTLLTRLIWVLLLSSPVFGQVEFDLLEEAIQQHADTKIFFDYVADCPATILGKIVESLQNSLASLLYSRQHQRSLTVIARLLTHLYHGNTAKNNRGVIPYKLFNNATAVELDEETIIKDWEIMQQNRATGTQNFCFSDFPCLVDTKFKAFLLQIDGIIEQRRAMQSALIGQLFSRTAATDSFLILNVHRERLIDSTLLELQRKSQSLKKPLRVKFVGEEGIDEGGVRKEFFQLLTQALLSPDYGMFYWTSQNFLWFQPEVRCQATKRDFWLIGQILGLAVQNNVILDLQFPKIVFRKLLNKSSDFQDLEELDPDMAQGLQELLRFEETPENTVEEVFCRNFVIDYDVFGQHQEVALVPGGEDIPITKENRQQFVDAMTKHVTTEAVQENFDNFRRGFFEVADRDFVRTMHPDELELLVCGNPVLDFHELEQHTRYDGYKKESATVKLFWKVLHSLDMTQKKLFLKFVTGSDRVPVGGLKDLHFVIGKNGDDGEQLPTSHTCFNHLLLPSYDTEEKMKAKLLLAIQNCQGFGLQ